MSKLWITADTHYSHKNICGPSVSSWDAGYRDYDSVKNMDDAIVESFNSRIAAEDTIYHLGDWSFGGKPKIAEFMDRLTCKNIVLIWGNHDYNIRKYNRDLFMETHHLLNRKLCGKRFVLCHYSMQVWEASHRGVLHCFGHSHHSIEGVGKSMDVGWCGFRKPLEVEEVISILDTKEIAFLDHHDKRTDP